MAQYSTLVDDDLLNLPVVQRSVAPKPEVPTNVAGATQRYSDIAQEQLDLAADAERTAADVGVTRAMAGQVKQDAADRAGAITSDMEQSRAITKQRMDEINASNDELRKKYKQPIVEPDRWKRILSGVVKVIGAIGAGSDSSGGAGLAAAMGLIDDKLNEEVTDQLRAKAEAGEQIATNEGLLKAIQDQSKSELERDVLTANAIYKEGAEQFDAYAEQAQSAEDALKYRKVASELRNRAGEIVVEGFKFQQAMKPKVAAVKPVPIDQIMDSMSMEQLQQAAANPGPYQVKAIERLQRIAPQGKPADTSADIPGYVRDKDVAPAQVTQANTAVVASSTLVSGLERLKELRKQVASGNTSVAQRNAMEVESRMIIGNMADTASQLAGGGQAGEAAKAQLMNDIPMPTQWDVWGRQEADPIAVYDAIANQVKVSRDAKLQALGYRPAQAQAAPSASSFKPGGFNKPPSPGASDSGRRGGSF